LTRLVSCDRHGLSTYRFHAVYEVTHCHSLLTGWWYFLHIINDGIVCHYSDGLDVEHRNLISMSVTAFDGPGVFFNLYFPPLPQPTWLSADRDRLRNAGPRVELLCNIVLFPLFRSWKPCLHAAGADDSIAVVTHLQRPRSLVLVFCDVPKCATVTFCIFCFHRANWHSSASLTEVYPCFFVICKANARV